MTAAKFWADDFDMDLGRLFPDLDEHLGETADVRLWTYGHTSYGRLNHPAVWNTHEGMTAFFGLDDSGRWKPDGYVSIDRNLIECAWREAVRDAWPHHYLLRVDGHPIWNTAPLQGAFMRLMYDVRGWQVIPAVEADRIRGHVLASVIAATRDLRALVESREDSNA